MAEQEKREESQKTLVAFVVGLLIGGMLVWAFTGPDKDDNDKMLGDDDTEMASSTDDMDDDDKDDAMVDDKKMEKLNVGEGDIQINDQAASKAISMKSAEYPLKEGWIGVREYDNDKLGKVLGVNRFSESQGLIPEKIELLHSTTPGHKYAIVIYEEDGDFDFDFAKDKQLETVYDTFMAK